MKKLYILLVVAFFGFVGNAQISYPSPLCINSTSIVVPLLEPGLSPGGTFSSTPGLVIHATTGQIILTASVPGVYYVTYSVPFTPPDTPAMTVSTTVVLVSVITPVFDSIPTFCYGSNSYPIMPSVSNNGVSGTWVSVATNVLNTITLGYEFTPNDQCAVPVTMSISVIQPVSGYITTPTGLNTVYVDSNNAVVAPLILSNEITSDDYTYQWIENGLYIEDATSGTYTVSTASTNGEDRIYTVEMTNVITECSSMSNEFVVHQSNGVPPPAGLVSQTLPSGSTLGNLVVSGTDIQWYASANDKNFTATALPLSTLLVDNTTYYASQNVNGNESVERLPVTAHLVLGVGENELTSVSYYPNPVKNSLTIKALNTIDSTSIINVLGQVLKTTKHNQAEVIEDMSEFSPGTYFIRVVSGSRTEVLKVVKQ